MPPSSIAPGEGRRFTIGNARPAVEEVRVDHQQHGDAAQEIEIAATLQAS
jgi:hypothetical protein